MGHFSLSVVGKDRRDRREVSRVLFELGCNIEDSSCTILCGQFAMILVIVHREFSRVPEIDPAFDPLREDMGLTISLHELDEEEVSREKGYEGRPHVISCVRGRPPGDRPRGGARAGRLRSERHGHDDPGRGPRARPCTS